MDTLPLPPRPSLAEYEQRAAGLVAASSSPDPGAIRSWAAEWLEALARARGVEVTPFVRGSFDRAVDTVEGQARDRLAAAGLGLADAQLLIARAHGFESWPQLAAHLAAIASPATTTGDFEAAADAVVDGDLPALQSLIGRRPELVRERSTREHRATLLHYVAANGVEDFRQRTPANGVAIARLLLEAGAEVDALASTYGGGSAQTTMNLLVSSAHPAAAGLQPALVDVLADFGAALDGVEGDGSPLMTALAFGYPDAAEALARRGARIDNIVAAAGLGRDHLVERFLAEGATSSVERGLVLACACGHTTVVARLLEHGVDPAATDPDGMTGLHWAAGNQQADVIDLMLARGAPLEAKNRWGGTVLGCTIFFAHQHRDAGNHARVVDTLLAAGADLSAVRYPTGLAAVDEVLARHGARPT
jgi:hypothetical protein